MSARPLSQPPARPGLAPTRPLRVVLIGNPNTGKTTLLNRLAFVRHKTSNFPGTTQEARLGRLPGSGAGSRDVELIDLPGVYSLELAQREAELCREVLAGRLAPAGAAAVDPDAVCVVVDAANLPRNLALVGEVLRRRLPIVLAVNMIDLARKRGLHVDAHALAAELGVPVVPVSARDGQGEEDLRRALRGEHTIPTCTPPPTRDELEAWAEGLYTRCVRLAGVPAAPVSPPPRAVRSALVDRVDAALVHPLWGLLVFSVLALGLLWTLFRLASYPMDLIDGGFSLLAQGARAVLPEGVLADLVSGGVVAGIGSTLIFLPQIFLLFFLISLLEDSGYLARAAFVADRVLRPFGLPGHAFVPLLSSHACALPGIMACRAIPDPKDRLAAILVAPFMSCAARLPVYALVVTLLFGSSPWRAALAMASCYALGILAGLASAMIARRTFLAGPGAPMALELPTYKRPSLRTAVMVSVDRSMVFLKKAGTNILAISIILWWLSAYPQVAAPPRALELRQQAAAAPEQSESLITQAQELEAMHASTHSYAGRLGRLIEPALAPLGYDWRLSIGVMTSFAAREVFVSTMSVVLAGHEDAEEAGVMERLASAKRDDGVTAVFTPAVCWSLLVYYVLAMQCLPTLAVTAREAGGVRWALLQLAWMSGLAYLAAMLTYQGLRAWGVA